MPYILPCTWCGTEKVFPYSRIDNSKSKAVFCSTECRVSWDKINRVGCNAPNWRGGLCKYRRIVGRHNERVDYGTITVNEWYDLLVSCKFSCVACGLSEPEIKLTIDHIFPLCRGGENSISNIQPLCKPCNLSKGRRIINFMTGIEVVDATHLPKELLRPNYSLIAHLVKLCGPSIEAVIGKGSIRVWRGTKPVIRG